MALQPPNVKLVEARRHRASPSLRREALLRRRQEIDWPKRKTLPVNVVEPVVVIRPELDESGVVHEDDPPLLLGSCLTLGLTRKAAGADEEADVLIAEHRQE